MIGTWRSASENLALFWSMSPIVAMRIVWLSAWVVTPRSAARSLRGVMMISGRMSSPCTRGATSSGTDSISVATCCAAWLSRIGIVAAEIEGDVAAAAAGAAAALAHEVDAGVADLVQLRRDLALDLEALLRPVVLEAHVDEADRREHALEHIFDVGVVIDDIGDLRRDRARLVERRARRHADPDRGVVDVLLGIERHRQLARRERQSGSRTQSRRPPSPTGGPAGAPWSSRRRSDAIRRSRRRSPGSSRPISQKTTNAAMAPAIRASGIAANQGRPTEPSSPLATNAAPMKTAITATITTVSIT